MVYELDKAYLSELGAILGGELDAFLRAMDDAPAQALRLNPLRDPAAAAPYLSEPVPWAPGGFYYRGRPGLSPAHAAGAYYIQEASAMTAAAVLNARPGEVILDLCAAPGGKSTQIAAAMGQTGALVCNEPEPSRCKVLAANLERMGAANSVAVCAYPDALAKRWPETFDAILCDAPCSGEGMFRRNPEAIAEWNPASPEGCAARQAQILDAAAIMLKPGGRLVYSTCTFNRTENEGTIGAFLERHPDFRTEEFSLNGLGRSRGGMLRVWPHRARGEGHFACKMVKQGTYVPENKKTPRVKPQDLSKQLSMLYEICRFELTGRKLRTQGEYVYALPNEMPELEGLKLAKAGLCLMRVGSGYIEPAHALAMAIDPARCQRTLVLNDEQANAYLRGEAIPCEGGRGWTLALWRNLPLGWTKISGGMAKNHLPKSLRM